MSRFTEGRARDIDFADQDPVVEGGRSGRAYIYAPSTYELCENDHPENPGRAVPPHLLPGEGLEGRGLLSTYSLGQPSECKRRLEASLPKNGGVSATVRVSPRDQRERQCPAYDAEHYEIRAFYTTASADSLDVLEEALKAVPGVYVTTQVRCTSDGVLVGNTFTNPGWPAPLGTARRGRHDLRPQVLALIRDEPPESHDAGWPGLEEGDPGREH